MLSGVQHDLIISRGQAVCDFSFIEEKHIVLFPLPVLEKGSKLL